MPAAPAATHVLSQRFFFESAHTLKRCVETDSSLRVHGHTYEAEVSVAGRPDPDSGMVVDLALLRAEIARVRELLDHRMLDEVAGLGPATLENLCSYIAAQLAATVPGLCEVRVFRRASGDACTLRWPPGAADSGG